MFDGFWPIPLPHCGAIPRKRKKVPFQNKVVPGWKLAETLQSRGGRLEVAESGWMVRDCRNRRIRESGTLDCLVGDKLLAQDCQSFWWTLSEKHESLCAGDTTLTIVSESFWWNTQRKTRIILCWWYHPQDCKFLISGEKHEWLPPKIICKVCMKSEGKIDAMLMHDSKVWKWLSKMSL